jgi:hypothetical protein
VSAAPPPESLEQGRNGNRSKISGTKWPLQRYQIKSPAASFSSLQVRQLIGHGHVKVNGRTVSYPGVRIQLTDKVELSGFVRDAAGGLPGH